MSSNDSSGDASLIGGHVKYVKGAASSALGYETGEQTKQEAVQEMRDASEASSEAKRGDGPDNGPTQSGILGQVESTLGQVTGCEGMEKEGAQRIPSRGTEESSGTG